MPFRGGKLDQHMSDQKHDCSWTRRRLTEIASTGSGLRGAGVSLPVLLRAFTGSDLVWFSAVYGDLNDSVLLVALERSEASSVAPAAERDPRERPPTVAQSGTVEPFDLSEELCARLGIRLSDEGYSIERQDLIRCHIAIHDDCFFLVEPADEALRKRILAAVLEQHGSYLGMNVDWSGVIEEITATAAATPPIRLKSDPERRRLIVTAGGSGSGMIERLLHRSTQRVVSVQGGKARFV